MRGRCVQKVLFRCYSACFGFRYLDVVCFVLRRRLTPTVCLHVCVMREGTAFPSHRSLNSDSLKSLLEELLDTHHGHLNTWTYTLREGKVCVLWKHAYDLTLAVSVSLYLHNPMSLVWYDNMVCFCLLSSRKLKGNSSFPVVCYVRFFFPQSPQIPQIFLRSSLLLSVTMKSRACFLSLKRGHEPIPALNGMF